MGNAVEDHSASRGKLGGIESLTSKKAVFRDRFGACHAVTSATKSTWLASKLWGIYTGIQLM